MAATKILADTGPLIAYLSQTDQHHCWAADAFGSFYEPIYTCEAVISEVLFLLRSADLDIENFLQLLERGQSKLISILRKIVRMFLICSASIRTNQ
jgi:predicted nucleic acid-binding protein